MAYGVMFKVYVQYPFNQSSDINFAVVLEAIYFMVKKKSC